MSNATELVLEFRFRRLWLLRLVARTKNKQLTRWVLTRIVAGEFRPKGTRRWRSLGPIEVVHV